MSTLGAIWATQNVGIRTQVPVTVYEKIAAAIRDERFPEAEQILRETLRGHPSEARLLSLMGVVLDAQKRFVEAEGFYRRALAINPRSAAALNNLGNHYLVRGEFAKARATYLRVVAVDPRHPNANHQLAQLSVAANQGSDALRYLGRLPAEERSAPAIQMLRAQALRSLKREDEAVELLTRIEKAATADPRLSFSLGMIYADWKRYEDAERAFSQALRASPANFDILYNLGLAALRARHFERAQEVLQIALQQRPDDVDLIQNLARMYAEVGRRDQAIVLLLQGEKIAPNRADIQMFLAHMAEESGFFGDAATAYDRYYQLRPQEDSARRDRGFCYARSSRIGDGLRDLRWYTARHPEDAMGWYQLGVVETVESRERAIQCFNKSLGVEPRLPAARYARGVILLQDGKPAAALEDLKIAVSENPKDAFTLNALGDAYLQLNQVDKAVESLRQAVELSPEEGKFLMRYGRALQRAGRREEAKAIFNRFKQMGPSEYSRRAKAGLFDYLRLPPDEQRAQYVKNLKAGLAGKPDDLSLQLRLGKALLMENKTEEAMEAYRKVMSLTQDPVIVAECATDLLGVEQYGLAREFLVRLVAAKPDDAGAKLDLAIAVFHSQGPEAGLESLDQMPPAKRGGDFFLLRAQILDALGRLPQAADYLSRGLQAEPTRADLFLQAALFLIKHGDYERASGLLEKAVRTFPDLPELQFTQAVVFAILRQHDTAHDILSKIEARWPEWNMPYVIHGIILTIRRRPSEAEPLLETAIALGAETSVAYFYLALALTIENPPNVPKAHEAVVKALALNPQDAFILALAGRIAYLQEDHQTAKEHLQAALRLWPDMVEAHQTLAGVYRAVGEKEKSIAELKEIVRIKQENPTADQTPPFPTQDLLFTVRPPDRPGS